MNWPTKKTEQLHKERRIGDGGNFVQSMLAICLEKLVFGKNR